MIHRREYPIKPFIQQVNYVGSTQMLGTWQKTQNSKDEMSLPDAAGLLTERRKWTDYIALTTQILSEEVSQGELFQQQIKEASPEEAQS